MVRLGDIIEQIRGVSYKPSDLSDTLNDNSVILLRANNIQDGKIVLDDVLYVSKSKVNESQYLKQGDILVCTSSGSKELVGKAAFVDKDLPMVFGAFCKVVRSKIECCKYIGHFFQSPYYRNHISAASAGANINNLRNEHIANLYIPLPSLNEQRHIAAVLDKVSDLIVKRRQQLDKLDKMVKAKFVEMFGDTILNPNHLQSIPLQNMADIVSGITKGRKTNYTELFEVPYMAVSNVKAGHIDWTTVKTIEATKAEIEQYRLLPYDVLMTEGGDPDKLGRGAIIKGPPKNCIHQNHIFRVRTDMTKLLPQYFEEYLQHAKAKKYFLNCAKQTTGIASINMKQLRNLPVLLPDLKQQREFSAFVEQIDCQKLTIQRSCDKLEVLKKALMQNYFKQS